MKNAKAKGARGEYKSRRLLESLGYYVVKAGGSLGCFDLVALSSVEALLIQVKHGREWPRPAEIEAMRAVPVPPNARRLVHRWRPRQRVPDVREL